MARHQTLYTPRAARDSHGRHRHLFRGSGTGISSVCQDAMFTVALVDDVRAPACSQCRLVALTELALAVDTLGLGELAIRIAAHASDASFETRGAQVDGDWSPGELTEAFGR